MIVVAGPRIDPETLPKAEGLEASACVHDLYRHLAGCDPAVVHEGLATAMELTASKRPFLYLPLRHHLEQTVHVRRRPGRYRAGRCTDFGNSPPDTIAEETGRAVDYADLEPGCAQRAAQRIAGLL